MITVTIGEQSREVDKGIQSWISEQFRQRRKAGEDVSVTVTIAKGAVDFGLVAPVRSGGGPGKALNKQEMAILELWRKHVLSSKEINVGRIVSFLNQIRDLA